MTTNIEASVKIINEELGAIDKHLSCVDKKLSSVITDVAWLKKLAFWELSIMSATLMASLGYLIFK